jgi:hypothetical protein
MHFSKCFVDFFREPENKLKQFVSSVMEQLGCMSMK